MRLIAGIVYLWRLTESISASTRNAHSIDRTGNIFFKEDIIFKPDAVVADNFDISGVIGDGKDRFFVWEQATSLEVLLASSHIECDSIRN